MRNARYPVISGEAVPVRKCHRCKLPHFNAHGFCAEGCRLAWQRDLDRQRARGWR
jgi:hypothetical protein